MRSALPAALAGVCLFFLGCDSGVAQRGGVWNAGDVSGHSMWAYASLFWAHALVGACLIFAFTAALKLRETKKRARIFSGHWRWGWRRDGRRLRNIRRLRLGDAGMLGSVAGMVAAGNAARWRVAAGVGLGAGICVIVFSAIFTRCLGRFVQAIRTTIRIVFVHAAARIFGADLPSSGSAAENYVWMLTRATVLCVAGGSGRSCGPMVAMEERMLIALRPWRRWRSLRITFLFNASFYWWKAGLSFGPRYAGASIPLLCVGLAIAWGRATAVWRRVLVGAGSVQRVRRG